MTQSEKIQLLSTLIPIQATTGKFPGYLNTSDFIAWAEPFIQ